MSFRCQSTISRLISSRQKTFGVTKTPKVFIICHKRSKLVPIRNRSLVAVLAQPARHDFEALPDLELVEIRVGELEEWAKVL